ncbi:MAG: cytochrome c [Actinomycetota bacterium]|nr:cytochrome c [Actinomycetota bacterium]
MKRSTLVLFWIVAIGCAIVLPALAISREGGEEASPQSVPADLQEGKQLFVTNCGSCHVLYRAGTDGVIGPDLDETLAPPSPTPVDPATIQPRVQSAIENGIEGRMPQGILTGPQAEQVASFVAQVAGTR